MRFDARAGIFAVLAFIPVIVLSFLCIYAGSKPGFLETYDLITVNTSRINVDIDLFQTNNASSSSSSQCRDGLRGLICNVKNNITSEIHNITTQVEDSIESAINNRLESIAKNLGLHDFYSLHVLNHCEGFFSPNGTANRNVTYCSSQNDVSSFNLTSELQAELSDRGLNITLPQLHWPEAIDDALHDLRNAFRAMYILYIISIVLAGLAFLGALFAIFVNLGIIALINVLTSALDALILMVVSIIITVAMNKASGIINDHGDEINVSASRGSKFLALTWAAFGLAVLGLGALIIGLCGRRRANKTPKKYVV